MISFSGTWFKDEHGRTLLLRGVNLDAKVPSRPDGATYRLEGFFDHRNVSFVGRPFPLSDADGHYRRLKRWGLSFLRFLVPWEAVEHAGPGLYDEEYLDYLTAMVRKAGEYDIPLYIDSRQDVWSRFSGGDGAPGWTFEAVGMDVRKFKDTGATVTQQEYGPSYLPQVWATNGNKLAAATMYTLFFGGNDFAPVTRVDGEPVQDYLQRLRVDAYKQVASRLSGMPHVLGYDTMNEPWKGYIGCADLTSAAWHMYRHGDSPTALQGMLLGMGIPQEVEAWRAFPPRRVGKRTLNPTGVKAWMDGHECVWKANGVWDADRRGNGVLLRPDHFTTVRGGQVDFARDYLRPYYNRFAEAIRSVDPKAVIFLTPPNEGYLPPPWREGDAGNIVYKPHWFDDVNWISKSYMPLLHRFVGHDRLTKKVVVGLPSAIQKSFDGQLRRIKEMAGGFHGGAPTVIGETGICYDLNRKKAYRTGNYACQVRVWDRIFRALDANLLNYTLWTYNAFNTNEHGDGWNKEDFSIFSLDGMDDPEDVNSGGRALEAVVRPYPKAVAGEPLKMSFDIKKRRFEFEFRHDERVKAPTLIFIPEYQYPEGCRVAISDGEYNIDAENQLLVYRHSPDREVHAVTVGPL